MKHQPGIEIVKMRPWPCSDSMVNTTVNMCCLLNLHSLQCLKPFRDQLVQDSAAKMNHIVVADFSAAMSCFSGDSTLCWIVDDWCEMIALT